MNALAAGLMQWWSDRTRRERWMIAGAALAVAAFAAWLLIARPLWAWRTAAAEDRARAVTELADARTALRRLGASVAPRPAPSAGIETVARTTAEAAGLSITSGTDASGHLAFQVPRASSAALFGWLSDLARNHGIAVGRITVTENADATLNVEGALTSAPLAD